MGKSEIAKRLEDLKPRTTILISSASCEINVINVIKNASLDRLEVIIADFSRDQCRKINMGVFEKFKNGRVSCEKYVGDTLRGEPPVIIIFANFEPNVHNTLSADRWRIGKVVATDREPEWSIVEMSDHDDPAQATWTIVRTQDVGLAVVDPEQIESTQYPDPDAASSSSSSSDSESDSDSSADDEDGGDQQGGNPVVGPVQTAEDDEENKTEDASATGAAVVAPAIAQAEPAAESSHKGNESLMEVDHAD